MTALVTIGFIVAYLAVGLGAARANLHLYFLVFGDNNRVCRHYHSRHYHHHDGDAERERQCLRDQASGCSLPAVLAWPGYVLYWIAFAGVYFCCWVVDRPTRREKLAEKAKQEKREFEAAAQLLKEKGIEP